MVVHVYGAKWVYVIANGNQFHKRSSLVPFMLKEHTLVILVRQFDQFLYIQDLGPLG